MTTSHPITAIRGSYRTRPNSGEGKEQLSSADLTVGERARDACPDAHKPRAPCARHVRQGDGTRTRENGWYFTVSVTATNRDRRLLRRSPLRRQPEGSMERRSRGTPGTNAAEKPLVSQAERNEACELRRYLLDRDVVAAHALTLQSKFPAADTATDAPAAPDADSVTMDAPSTGPMRSNSHATRCDESKVRWLTILYLPVFANSNYSCPVRRITAIATIV